MCPKSEPDCPLVYGSPPPISPCSVTGYTAACCQENGELDRDLVELGCEMIQRTDNAHESGAVLA